jgi:hypothetical protein
VTYNGVAMTRVAQIPLGANDNTRLWMYVLFNPDTGTHPVVVTFGNNEGLFAVGASYTGATSTKSAVAGLDDVQTNAMNGITTITATTTSVASGDWAISGQANGKHTLILDWG